MRAIKQPSEKVAFRYEFAEDLAGIAIGSIIGVPVSTPRNGGANMTLSGAASIDGTAVVATWQGGADGESYLTTVKIADASGNTHERDGEVFVFEKTFTLPVGVTSRYLTADEYVARYGFAETVRLTDEDQTRVVNTVTLEAALRDATEIADAYIGTRYTIPLTDVPRVVSSIVGALAREALHKSRPTPEVTAAADRARSQLKDISSGKMVLPVDAGQTAPVAGENRESATSGDSPSTFADNVSTYNLNPGGYVANWRR
jgi:phage gp36-like protein